MSKKLPYAAAMCLAGVSLIACESRRGPTTAPASAAAPWQLEKFPVFVGGFDSPECVAVDEKRNLLYVPMLYKGKVAIYKLLRK